MRSIWHSCCCIEHIIVPTFSVSDVFYLFIFAFFQIDCAIPILLACMCFSWLCWALTVYSICAENVNPERCYCVFIWFGLAIVCSLLSCLFSILVRRWMLWIASLLELLFKLLWCSYLQTSFYGYMLCVLEYILARCWISKDISLTLEKIYDFDFILSIPASFRSQTQYSIVYFVFCCCAVSSLSE